MGHCTRYVEAIQELVDGTLGRLRRSELEIHLDQCEGCRALLADLERVRDLVRSLDRPAPPARIWMQVAGQLRQEGRLRPAPVVAPTRRHYALAAIAATLLLAVGGSVLLVLPAVRGARQGAAPTAAARGQAPGAGNADPAAAVQQSIEDEFRLAEQHYQNAIAKLEDAAKSDQDVIDPQTAAMLQKNLHVIDKAIAESRAALGTEPESAPARDSLFEALRRKVSLLQDTIALMNEMRKGNAAGVAQIVDGTKG